LVGSWIITISSIPASQRSTIADIRHRPALADETEARFLAADEKHFSPTPAPIESTATIGRPAAVIGRQRLTMST
jgi:hypothetical protein